MSLFANNVVLVENTMFHSLGPRLSMKGASLSSPSHSLHSKRRGGIRSLNYKKCLDGKPEVVVIQAGENNIIACKDYSNQYVTSLIMQLAEQLSREDFIKKVIASWRSPRVRPLQRKAIRFMTNSSYIAHTAPLLIGHDLLHVHDNV